jgi:hypothetical protein
MADYHFNLLTPIDFEELVRDIIQKEYNIRLECFTQGKDSGIDFRYIGSEDSKLIIQCKHYQKSSYTKLTSDLKNIEILKVKKLNPDRYIFATSQGLTPENKDEIKQIFEPYIKKTEDIFGFDDLNNLLRIHVDVAKKNYKLWFTSADVLDRIIHSSVYNQSNFEIENLKEIVKIFVKNRAYFDVKKRLKDDNFCIIVGNPGIGKSTIAQYILSQYLERDFEVISCNTIEDAFKVYNPQKRQIFYYDDFLGQTIFSEKLVKNEDNRILQFIAVIEKSKTTKFLLTTRLYILNQAQLAYEKLNNPLIETGKYTVELTDYTLFERAKIFYNHLWYSDISEDKIYEIIKNRLYLDIISHRNFTPRIIQILTSTHLDFQGSYAEHFFYNLDNPETIWEHAFEHQISDASRNLLLVLNSLPVRTGINKVKQAFFSFHKYRTLKYNQAQKSDDFKNALRELNGSFILIVPISRKSNFSIDFENPSIKDYINNYILKNFELISELCDSSIYFQQNLVLWNLFDSLKYKYGLELEDYSIIFVKSFIRTYYTDLREYDQWYHYHSKWIDGIFDYSFEQRLQFLIRLSLSLENTELDEFISKLLNELILKVTEERVDKRDLMHLSELISSIDDIDYHFEISKIKIFTIIKEVTISRLEELEDFEYLLDLLKVFQQELLSGELETVKSRFIEEFRGVLDGNRYIFTAQINDQFNSEYVSSLEQFLSDLRKISDYLDIEIDEEINLLQEKVDKLYQDWEPDEDDFYEEYREKQADEKRMQSQIQIDELFSNFNK